MIDHWMTTGLLGANASFQRAAREYAEEYAAMTVAAERERCAKVCVVPLNIAVENDAERYQWIRNSDWDCFDSRWLSAHDAYGAGPDELDALIDAKMAENKAVG